MVKWRFNTSHAVQQWLHDLHQGDQYPSNTLLPIFDLHSAGPGFYGHTRSHQPLHLQHWLLFPVLQWDLQMKQIPTFWDTDTLFQPSALQHRIWWGTIQHLKMPCYKVSYHFNLTSSNFLFGLDVWVMFANIIVETRYLVHVPDVFSLNICFFSSLTFFLTPFF